jgi:hypothetical protein
MAIWSETPNQCLRRIRTPTPGIVGGNIIAKVQSSGLHVFRLGKFTRFQGLVVPARAVACLERKISQE